MFEKANWIWKTGDRRPINEHIIFRKTFEWAAALSNRAMLSISADTKYRLWVNGTELGEGPIRSTADHWYYDEFDITHLLRPGANAIAVKVWHYGHSNYQYVENEAGLIAQLSLHGSAGIQVIGTDETWLYRRHEGYDADVVKRNVNIGWMEIYDANAMSEQWVLPSYDDRNWARSEVVAPYGGVPWGKLYPRGIEPLSTQIVRPKQIIALSEIVPIRQVISVNMRENLYPDSRDANAKIFSGFLAVKLVAEAEACGRLTFAHSKWNGVQGRFRIDDRWYVHNDEIQVAAGEHLFLMEICGVHNDLFSHMEFDFDTELRFAHPFEGNQDASFVTIGPFETIESHADGFQPVYGGVEKSTGLNHEHPLLLEIGACSTLTALEAYKDMCKDVHSRHVLVNNMIYSLMMRKRVVKHYPVTNRLERMLHDHLLPTELPVPMEGGDIEIVLDFGKIYVGTIELEVDAPQGTVIDVYGFENRVNGVNAYTSGCNNSFRYICRDGRQMFKSFTRMGFRYLIVTVRKADVQMRIHRLQLHQSSYPATDKALFRCSDPLLNDIWEISRHTSQMCMEDTFVDCPTYEQVFWVGDCRVSALVNYQLFGSYELVRHCLEMVPRSRSQSPLLLALLPTDWQAAIPMWTFSWIIACKEYVDYSGDSTFFEAIYPEIRETLDAYRGFLNKDGLFDTSSWNMLDWAPIDIPYVGVVTAQQAQLAQCHRIAAKMAESLGLHSEAETLLNHAEQLKRAIQEHLWDEDAQDYLDGIYRNGKPSTTRSLQTHVLLYLADCLGERQTAVIKLKLLDPPEDWIKIGSPFFSFYLFEVWQRFGELDRTLAQIRTDWGKMIQYGATTTWETFHVFPRSHAHAWSSAPAFVLGNQLLGVEKLEEGYRKIRIAPPVTELLWADGIVPTAYGRIDVSWSKEEDKRVMRVSVPRDIQVEAAPELSEDWDIQIHVIG
ncbi:Bacterial alpha-L-rhamnosidase [Paenibacillus sp. LMG 31460]|uniref:Bacterial alpha-L-rhamnosidase n=1 Tax=Paenibacillus germinis TaxID=2654979 RepID=A0ABX1YY59_9BACL|nr:family 78 glycoside hydrolase catalytic domain [Paenibacillus germinis]NOU85878.1 Bacterial alpha-L-rhamnosidase [Paenibacillus germinis]